MTRLSLALLLVAAAAQAQPAPTLAPRMPTPDLIPRDVQVRFESADLDNSGHLTRDEAIKGGFSGDAFAAVDKDNDRIVTVYEIGVYLTDKTKAWADADKDGDGSISRDEAAASPTLKDTFDKADNDADGILRKQEHEAWAQTTLYQNVDLPYVVPNIINKKF